MYSEGDASYARTQVITPHSTNRPAHTSLHAAEPTTAHQATQLAKIIQAQRKQLSRILKRFKPFTIKGDIITTPNPLPASIIRSLTSINPFVVVVQHAN